MKPRVTTAVLFSAIAFLGASSLSFAQQSKPSNKYDGMYYVTQVEFAIFGCQNDTTDITGDEADPYGGPANFFAHHQAEQDSGFSQRTGAFEAESSGGVISFPSIALEQVELRMDGTPDTSTRPLDDPFDAVIDATGRITIPVAVENGIKVDGQFSADGSLFNILAVGISPEEGDCQDSFSLQILGISMGV